MQSDKELLMLAAKASGKSLAGWEFGGQSFWAYRGLHNDAVIYWSPLTDDGDCARLEAACEIDICWGSGCVSAQINFPAIDVCEDFHRHGGDKNKARRYASTRAAASIAQQGVSE